jgi:hypothetical protein
VFFALALLHLSNATSISETGFVCMKTGTHLQARKEALERLLTTITLPTRRNRTQVTTPLLMRTPPLTTLSRARMTALAAILTPPGL